MRVPGRGRLEREAGLSCVNRLISEERFDIYEVKCRTVRTGSIIMGMLCVHHGIAADVAHIYYRIFDLIDVKFFA